MPITGSPISTGRMWRYASMLQGGEPVPYHGDCTNPRTVEVRAAESTLLSRLADWSDGSVDYADGYGITPGSEWTRPDQVTAYLNVRCRECDACLMHRRKLWTARAIAETRIASRNWFVTLTFKPEVRFHYTLLADQLVQRRWGEALRQLSSENQFRAIARATGQEVTRWLKRVRKASRARLRYLLVSEAHEDGFPHYHLLVHEVSGQVTKRHLEQAWSRNGFSHCRLLDSGDVKATGYACKYLSKSAQTRVRASRRYGQPDIGRITELLRNSSDTVSRIAKQGENVCQKGVP